MTTEVYLGKKLSALEQFSELLRSQNDYLSQAQHFDTHCCSAVDNRRGSSAMDLTNTAQTFSVFTEVSEPCSAGNYDFSDNMNGQHFSQSDVIFGPTSTNDQSERNQNGRIGPTDFDCDPTTSFPYVIDKSQRPWNFRKTKSRQNTKTEMYTGDGLYAGKVSFDLDMMHITRKTRSLSKRVRASAWGLLSNLELDLVNNSDRRIIPTKPENLSRSRSQASRKQKRNQPKNHDLIDHEKPSRSRAQASGNTNNNQVKGLSNVVRKKRSHRTSGISVKFKAGVGVGLGSLMDASNEGHLEIIGKTPVLPEEEEKLINSMMNRGIKSNMKWMEHMSDDSTHNVRKYVVENISNSGSDLGTSPDSEVINRNIETSLWCSEEEFHNLPGSSHICTASDGVTRLVPKNTKETQEQVFKSGCSAVDKLLKLRIVDDIQSAELGKIVVDVPYSISISASSSSVFEPGNTSSTERKSKEQASPVADIELPCVPSTDIGTEVTPIVGLDLQSPVLHVFAKGPLHSKGQNVLNGEKTNRVTKSRSKIHVSANKGRCDSRKEGNRPKLASKYKLKVKLQGGLIPSEAKNLTGPGDSKLAVSGESVTANSSLSGDESTYSVVPGGCAEQTKKPRNAWVLCDDCQKWRRIPVTLADHLEETNCSWTCKDNVDKNFGNCSIPQEKSDAQINAELEISDASCDEGVWDARLNSNNLGDDRPTGPQRPTWKLIKSNQFLHRSQQTQTIDEIMVCHCKPPSDGQMGCGDGCLNRMLSIECVQGTCPCGELCSNQQFQKRDYARLMMLKCGKKGYGVQVLDNISEGQFLIEYVGEVLDMNSYEARQRDYAMQGHKHFYFMTLNGSEVIDARAKGNLGRFINHSCDPNCRTEKWMVNGEVCIGLFALKNIQKGEELTFDYNYVRVFGAAAKKCVCESSQCRGYIGGPSQNKEIVVQDDSEDEYPEPVMVCEDGAVYESYRDMTSLLSTFDSIGARPEMRPKSDESVDVMSPQCFATTLQAVETEVSNDIVKITSVVEHEDTIDERMDHLTTCGSTDLNGDTSKRTEDLCETLAPCKVVLKQDDISSQTLVTGEPESFKAGENVKQSCLTATLEENSANIVLNHLLPDAVDNKRKPKSDSLKQNIKSPVSKAYQLTSLTNSQSTSVNVQKVQETQGKDDLLSCKPKEEVDISSTCRLEAVQKKLNELLNRDGGISKRKDASKGYLKLLVLTAASGDSCNGEAIQSNRDLSMILGALLETKSRTVLVDIINKNGLQMLHNMLKRSRKEFNKIPILRKLLKVFEYLATLKILTSEHISGGPTCPGVESFTESILSLTEHVDKQVHKIARSLRDRWIPRSARRHQREERVVDFCRSSVHKQWSNQVEKRLETPDYITTSVEIPTKLDTGMVGVSCQSTDVARNTRKRKSRWDQPEDLYMTDDGMKSIDNDLPPGFAASCHPTVVSSEVCSFSSRRCITTDLNHTCQVVSAQPQLRFTSCLPVSYGVPVGLVNREGVENMSVVPGMPFHPFPPLPPYPHNTQNSASNAVDSAVTGQPAHNQNRSVSYNSGPNPPIPQEAIMPALERPGTVKYLNVRRPRGTSTLGRKHFRPRKWNSSTLGPPWIRNRYKWGFRDSR